MLFLCFPVRQFLTWTSSVISSNFLNATLSFADQLGSLQKHDPWDYQLHFGSWVLMTSVFPTVLVLNITGYFTAHQSSWENGSTTFSLAPFLLRSVRCLFLLPAMASLFTLLVVAFEEIKSLIYQCFPLWLVHLCSKKTLFLFSQVCEDILQCFLRETLNF